MVFALPLAKSWAKSKCRTMGKQPHNGIFTTQNTLPLKNQKYKDYFRTHENAECEMLGGQ